MDFRACHVFSVSADCTSSAIAATWLVPTFYPGSSPWSRLPHLTTWATLICLPWTMKNLWILPSISTPVAEQLSWGFSLMIPSIQINHIIISYHITSYHNVCKTVVPIIYIYVCWASVSTIHKQKKQWHQLTVTATSPVLVYSRLVKSYTELGDLEQDGRMPPSSTTYRLKFESIYGIIWFKYICK